MIGIDNQRKFTGAANAMRLVGKFAEREHDQIRRAEHGKRRYRTGKHAGLEAEILGDTRRNRVVY